MRISDQLEALRTSVGRLRATVEPLDDATLDNPAYPSKWSIAQVLSHIGAGAVIVHRYLHDGLEGRDIPSDFMRVVWDEWNAKTSPRPGRRRSPGRRRPPRPPRRPHP